MLCAQLELEHPVHPKAQMALYSDPLYRVRARLLTRHPPLCRAPPRKPWQLTLRYDEVAALRYTLPVAPLAG